MTKLMKLMPAALGMLVLASCNSDDVIGTDRNIDLSGRTVLAVTNGDAVQTRSFRGAAANSVYYDKGDKLRVYDSNLQKYDEFVFSGTVKSESSFFVLADESNPNITETNAETGKMDYAFALYGTAENLVSYAGWNGGKITALVKIKDSFDYSEETTADVDGQVVYKDAIPTFGVISEAYNDDIVSDKAAFKTSLNMLTGMARVVFENGAQSGAQYVRVSSLKFADGKGTTDFDALGNKAQETTNRGTGIFEEDGAKPLAGWFEAFLTKNPATEAYGLREITESANADAVNKAKETTITVKVDEGAMNAYTNIVYFPIVPADYSDGILLYEYSTNGSDWKYVGYFSGNVERAKAAGNFTVATELSYEGITIPGADLAQDKGLQTVIEEAVKLNKAVVIDINATGKADIKVGDYTSKDNFNVIELPKLDNDITLNIHGNITGDNSTLTIKDAASVATAGEGTLTINYIGKDAAVKPQIVLNTKANVALENAGTNGYDGNLTVTNVGDLTLKGKFNKDSASPSVTIASVNNLTLNGNFGGAVTVAENTTLTGNVSISGQFYQTMNLATTGNITVDGATTMNGAPVFTAANIAINSNMTLQSALTTNGVVTVPADVTVGGLTLVSGTSATIAGKVTNLTTNKVPVTITGEVTNLTTEGATVTINSLTTEKNVSGEDVIKARTISTLVFKAPATINLNNGIIRTVSKNYDYEKGKTGCAVVNSTGKSAIYEVTDVDNWINFYSKWTGETVSQSDCDWNNIYTAAQFASRSLYETWNNVWTIWTDIDMEGYAFTPLQIKKGATMQGVTRDDNTITTISNVAIKGEYASGNLGLFKQLTNTGSGKSTIKNLHIQNITVDVSAKSDDALNNIGGLIGRANGDLDIENVTIDGTNSIKAGDDAYDIGGLIGKVDGSVTVNVVSTDVKTAIEGSHNLGGVIGSVAENAIVTFGKTKNKEAEGVKAGATTIKVLAEMEDERNDKAGKVGLAVGELNGKLSLQYFTASWTANDPINDWKYDKCRFFINDNTMVFKGCKNGSNIRYYVGYSPAAQEFKLQEKEMKKGYDGTNYTLEEDGATYNIFEKLNK